MRDYQNKENQGGVPDSNTATKYGANEVNSIRSELKNSVSDTGLTLAPQDGVGEDTTQLSQALFINGTSASSFQDNGAADAYVLTPATGATGLRLPPDYSTLNGAEFSFFPAFANATVTPTASIGQTVGTQFGVKNIVAEDGGAVSTGDLSPNQLAILRYDLPGDQFILVKRATNTDIGAMEFILKQTAANDAIIEFTANIDSTYERYIFIFDGLAPQNDGVNFHSRVSTDGGSSYEATNYYWAFAGANQSTPDATYSNSGVSTTTEMIINGTFNQTQVGNAAGEGFSGTLNLSNPSDPTQFTRMFFDGVWSRDDMTADETRGWSSGGWKVVTAVDAIQFYFSSGNIVSGTISLYGIKSN